MFHVSSSESTSTGAPRSYAIAFADAMNVSDGTSTSSPGSTPASRIATCSAAVPVAHATACFAPTYAANSRSNRSTNGPTDDTKFVVTHSSRYLRSLPPRYGSLSGTRSDMVLVPVQMHVLAHPLGGAAEAVLEGDRVAPAEQLVRARRIGLEHQHLAGVGAQPLGVELERCLL